MGNIQVFSSDDSEEHVETSLLLEENKAPRIQFGDKKKDEIRLKTLTTTKLDEDPTDPT